MNSYTKEELFRLNTYYGGWIQNVDSLKETQKFYLYPTGYCSLQGRDYVAVPVDKKLTNEDKRRLNIM
jgi:hypothetical protein